MKAALANPNADVAQAPALLRDSVDTLLPPAVAELSKLRKLRKLQVDIAKIEYGDSVERFATLRATLNRLGCSYATFVIDHFPIKELSRRNSCGR